MCKAKFRYAIQVADLVSDLQTGFSARTCLRPALEPIKSQAAWSQTSRKLVADPHELAQSQVGNCDLDSVLAFRGRICSSPNTAACPPTSYGP